VALADHIKDPVMRRLALVVAPFASVAVAALALSPIAAQAHPDNGRPVAIAVAGEAPSRQAPVESRVYFSWHCNIYSIKPNGKARHQVTETAGCEGTPMASPDGETLAFKMFTRSGAGRGIGTFDLDSGRSHRLRGTHGASWVNWSPDSTRISYDAPKKNGRYQVWIIRANGSRKHAITTGFPTAYTAAWSANGKRMFFTTDAERFRSDELGCSYAPSAIYSVPLSGGRHRLERGDSRLDSYPSDAGKSLVSVSVRLRQDTDPGAGCEPGRGRNTVYVDNRPVLRNAWYATLSPDRTRLLFHDDRTNRLAISTLGGSHRHAIPNVPRGTYGSWAPAH
jgi:Tol biopolymer transport system component